MHADGARYNDNGVLIATSDAGSKIYPNSDADLNEYPFVAYLTRSDGSHTCTGSLVNREYVLTAAHCLGEIAFVVLGDYDRGTVGGSSSRQVIAVEEEIPHPDYYKIYNDVALLKLASKARVRSDAVGLVSMLKSKALKRKFMNNKRNCMVLGWGLTQYNRTWYLANKLQEQKTLYVDAYEAQERGWYPIDGVIYMEADHPEECQLGSICFGDSGGPTVCQNRGEWFQVGITSFLGRNDGCAFGINGHTDVEYFIDWIEDTISGA